MDLLARLRAYDRIARISTIGRRYFAMNAFDGSVTMIGVLAGSFTAGITDARVVLVTGFATSVAMGISGLWGAYLTEAAERRRELRELERQTLSKLDGSELGEASRAAVVIVALLDALTPLLAASIALIPFLLVGLLPSIETAYYTGFGLALLTLFGVGLFLGRISRGSMLLFGLKTVIAGVAAIGFGFLLRGFGE